MESFAASLPAAAVSPLAFVAYLALLVTGLALRLYAQQQNADLKKILAARDQDRLEVIRTVSRPRLERYTADDHHQLTKLKVTFALYIGLFFLILATIGIGAFCLLNIQINLAGVTCSGINCNRKDPGETRCADRSNTMDKAQVIDRSGQVIGIVELRWSELCRTNWARVDTPTYETPHRLQAYLKDENGQIIYGTYFTAPKEKGIYGDMHFAAGGLSKVQACGIIDDHEEVCTRSR
jgi:hypothetical protein